MLRAAVERVVRDYRRGALTACETRQRSHLEDQRVSADHRVRNILIHGYADVDDRLVWDIVETKLPVLSKEIDSLLDASST